MRCLEVEVDGVGGVGTGTACVAERVGVTGIATWLAGGAGGGGGAILGGRAGGGGVDSRRECGGGEGGCIARWRRRGGSQLHRRRPWTLSNRVRSHSKRKEADKAWCKSETDSETGCKRPRRPLTVLRQLAELQRLYELF